MTIRRKDDKIIGIGGIKCGCCRMGTVKDSKVLISRRDRHKSKQEFEQESERKEG